MTAETDKKGPRAAEGPVAWVVGAACMFIPLLMILYVLQLYRFLGLTVMTQQYVGAFLGLVLFIAYLVFPANKKTVSPQVPWYDLLFALAGLFVGFYLVVYYPRIMFILAKTTPPKVLLGLVAILLVLEAVRRVVGWSLTLIIVAFILYAHFGYLFPGVFNTKGVPWDRLLWSLYASPDNLIGSALTVGAVVVATFILFGRFYYAAGGGQVMIDSALAIFGRYRGGPAKGAVVSSLLFGTMSGSAVANVVTTGIFTIPLMKRNGYSPEFASAVEATVSTGGQIVPPVLGVAAFLMAEVLNIPYVAIAVAALLPAFFYYLSVFVQIDLRAAKENLHGLEVKDLPDLKGTLKAGWLMLIVPLAALIYFLFVMSLQPEEAALYAAAAIIPLSFFKKDARLGWRKILTVLRETGMGVIEIGVACAGAGIILGVVSQTGIGFSLAQAFTALAEHSVILLLMLVALSSAILGMGLPVIASYAILAVIAAPALVDLGLDPLASHLFILYYGVLSFLTPPVCMSVYAAAGIGKADFLKTAWRAMGLAIVAYIIPFFFVVNPAILLKGSAREVLLAAASCTVAVLALSAVVEGYFLAELSWLKRILLTIGAFLLFDKSWETSLAGLAIVVIITLFEIRRSKATQRKAAA